MAKKLAKYLMVEKVHEGVNYITFPDFKGYYSVSTNPAQAVFAGLKLLKNNIDKWLEEHDILPVPTSIVDMSKWDYCIWVPVTIDDSNEPGSENDEKDRIENKIFSLEELEKDLGIDLE